MFHDFCLKNRVCLALSGGSKPQTPFVQRQRSDRCFLLHRPWPSLVRYGKLLQGQAQDPTAESKPMVRVPAAAFAPCIISTFNEVFATQDLFEQLSIHCFQDLASTQDPAMALSTRFLLRSLRTSAQRDGPVPTVDIVHLKVVPFWEKHGCGLVV